MQALAWEGPDAAEAPSSWGADATQNNLADSPYDPAYNPSDWGMSLPPDEQGESFPVWLGWAFVCMPGMGPCILQRSCMWRALQGKSLSIVCCWQLNATLAKLGTEARGSIHPTMTLHIIPANMAWYGLECRCKKLPRMSILLVV